MQESGLAAASSAGALAVRTGPPPGVSACSQGSRPAGLDTDCWTVAESGCCQDVLCSNLGTTGLRPMLGRSLPRLTCKTSVTARSGDHQIKCVISMLKQIEMVL